MIRSLRLQNFKAIRDVEVSFERLTVFVGPNGSGKTSFLQGLELFSRTPRMGSYNEFNQHVYKNFHRDRYSIDNEMILTGTNEHGTVLLGITPKISNTSSFGFVDTSDLEDLYRIEISDLNQKKYQVLSRLAIGLRSKTTRRCGIIQL